jgi:hypothetical protein
MKQKAKIDVVPVVRRRKPKKKPVLAAPVIEEEEQKSNPAPVSKARKWVRRLAMRLVVVVVFLLCGFISAFLLTSGYESMFNRSLPFVRTIEPINLRAFIGVLDLRDASTQDPKRYGIYGKPTTLKMPQQSLRLDIVPPLQEDNTTWLSRASTMHLLTPSEPRKGSIGLAIFYCRSSFRTINSHNMPPDGANIFMDTDTLWRYVYKVTGTSVAPEAQEYILADSGDSGRLLISCNDAKTKTNLYIEAKLLSIQGVSS